MEQRRTFFQETGPGNANVVGERAGGYAREEVLDWLIAICRLVIKGDFLELEIVEEPT